MSDIGRSLAPASEAQPRTAAGTAALTAALTATGPTTLTGDADDDLLAFLEIAALDLRRRAVRDAERDLDGDRLAVRPADEHASRGAGAPFRGGASHLVVLGLLLRREERANLLPRGFADGLRPRATLGLIETL